MIKISADSTCDLSPEIIQKFDISIVPLTVVAGDREYRDGLDITSADVFRFSDEQGLTCKTSAVNTFEYQDVFEKLSAGCDALIHINISSEFSSCYQNACTASENFKNVYVVDSRNLSSGSGHIVYEAALMVEQGIKPGDICSALKELTGKVEASFVIDRLDYLAKGGRCSALAAQGARLFRLKPCIEVTDGKMAVGRKFQGSFDRCLAEYVKDRLQDRMDIDLRRIFVTHPMCSEQTVEKVITEIRKYQEFDEIIETRAGCTISCHCGPNTLGILFMRK
jgi:DegV family protein with EDD domain